MILNGLCVSNGNAFGVVYNTETSGIIDIPEFSEKTIIVTRVLDRNIIKAINKNVTGVVAEKGSIGSHAAGNLRAMKIPCVLRISNATKILSDGVPICINGEENCINIPDDCIVYSNDTENSIYGKEYDKVKDGIIRIDEIQPMNYWYILRPNRKYENLRYDIIKDSFTDSSLFLFGLEAKVRQNKDGVLEVYGFPSSMEICKFYLKNPSWVIEKSKESSCYLGHIRDNINSLVPLCENKDFHSAKIAFEQAVSSLKALYKYMLLAQTTSDEIIDIYIDFMNMLTSSNHSRDICCLYSDYIAQDLKNKSIQGGFLSWGVNTQYSPIYNGNIDYSEWNEDREIIDAINARDINERKELYSDYSAFRMLVPVLYQKSEEFAHFSKGINSFLVWSINTLWSYLVTIDDSLTVERIFQMDLFSFRNIIQEYLQL